MRVPRWRWLGLALFAIVTTAPPAAAAEWNTIRPGVSTVDAVRARFGPATKTSIQKLEGYDATQWVYEGAAAPPGTTRLTVEFGLLTLLGFRADLVRDFTVVPKPGIFNRRTILNGWGPPSRVGREGDAEVFLYRSGLVVYFAKDGWDAQLLVFTPPQPQIEDPAQSQP
jgi:hypothetical protein